MISDSDLLAEFNKNVGDFFPATSRQRSEIYTAFEYRDCRQWNDADINERKRLDKAVTVINMAAPLVRAVSGTECMQDKGLDYVPMDDQFNAEADIMSDAVEYAQYASGFDSEQSMAREDAVVSGLGATVTYLDMTKKDFIAGVPVVERVFPGFCFYDNSSRGARLNDRARWCGYGDPMDYDALSEYMEEQVGEKQIALGTGGGGFTDQMLSFSRQDSLHKIDMLYHYFWWEYSDIYDVMNPFADQQNPLRALILNDIDVANMFGAAADKMQIDWEATYWSLDKESFKELKDTLEAIGLLVGEEIEVPDYSKRKGKCFYRAEIARNTVLSKSRSYTQGGHPLNFITGYYDETEGIFYGMMRPISFIQDALNISTSDFLSYAKSASHGGAAYIKGAGEAFERIKKEKAYEDSLTPLPANAEVIPKATPSTPQVLVDFIRLMMEVMPRALGLGQEFLGVISTGDMTDSLYGKVMKQSYAVLANFSNNSASYVRRQGEIFVDIIKLMANANDGMILPVLSPGKQGDQYVRLRKQNLARSYAVRLVERAMTADEKQDTFNKFIALQGSLPPELATAFMPIIIKNAPFDQDDKDKMIEIITPKPQPPNPLNDALIQSQIRVGNAQAAKWEMEAAEKQETIPVAKPEIESVIQKNIAQAAKSRADARSPA